MLFHSFTDVYIGPAEATLNIFEFIATKWSVRFEEHWPALPHTTINSFIKSVSGDKALQTSVTMLVYRYHSTLKTTEWILFHNYLNYME
ncbi:hypothetical protein TcasGA2_TC008328 [Tribolium castaneum]|uniref:Uncharacterized protein n=1 Tax=Tribolium castaneum TaxID=7070 RepID=D2A146_TRICA|nr:hypothetical protein TcasGA2_TC008328 [Tribolium castaneum]